MNTYLGKQLYYDGCGIQCYTQSISQMEEYNYYRWQSSHVTQTERTLLF